MTKLPRLLIVSGVWPHIAGSREAANVISHQITLHLAMSGRFELLYCVINAFDSILPQAARPEVEALKSRGVTFVGPVQPSSEPFAGQGMWSRLKAVLGGRSDRLMVGTDRVLMCRGGVAKNPHDLVLRQQPAIVQGKQERLADR